MKIKVEYTPKMIKELIVKDMYGKIGYSMDEKDIDIKVKSYQNYREKEWETGELKVELEADI